MSGTFFLGAVPAIRAALSQGISIGIDSSGKITIDKDGAGGAAPAIDIENYDPYSHLFENYKGIAMAILGICVITSILCLFFQITKLGAAGDNEQERAKAIKGIFVSGFVLAGFGSLAVVVGVFWNAIA